MLVAFFTNPDAVGPITVEPTQDNGMTLLGVFLLAILFKPDFGVFMAILKGLIVIAFLPAVISLIFSIHTGLRPSA